MIKPAVIDALVAAGATPEMLAAAWKADQEKSSSKERQAAYRARKKVTPVTESDVTRVTVTQEGSDGSNESINSNLLSSQETTPLRSVVCARATPPDIEPAPKRRAKPRSPISPDEQPVEDDLEFARKFGLDSTRIREEWAQFRDHHLNRATMMADKRAAWRTWVRNAVGRFNYVRPELNRNVYLDRASQHAVLDRMYEQEAEEERRAAEAAWELDEVGTNEKRRGDRKDDPGLFEVIPLFAPRTG